MKKLLLLVIALACLSGWSVPSAEALSFSIALGDQPYYVHGPGYWAHGVYWVWVPGHWKYRHHHRVWVHGHYAKRLR